MQKNSRRWLAALMVTIACSAGFAEGPSAGQLVGTLNALLSEAPEVRAETREDVVTLCGWTRDETERALVERVLGRYGEVLDLTTSDVAQGPKMLDVDVVIVVVGQTVSSSTGFDFLSLINVQNDFFAAKHKREGTGFVAPGLAGAVSPALQWGEMVSAKIDYNVSIARAGDETAAVIARPHLATLNGQQAEFLAGGEIVFKVGGLENGDIKPYPFGIKLLVTPTVLRTLSSDGETQVRIDVEAERLSVLGRLLVSASDTGSEDVNFDKTNVKSKTLMNLGETLVLSGLYQREYRQRFSGVPFLRAIPLVGLLFSNRVEVDDVLSTIIFITPREAAKVDETLRRDIDEFIERRVAYIEALEIGGSAVTDFQEKYPDWHTIQPNRFATHLFLVNNSEVYRKLRGEDLRSEGLRRDIFSVESAGEASRGRHGRRVVPF